MAPIALSQTDTLPSPSPTTLKLNLNARNVPHPLPSASELAAQSETPAQPAVVQDPTQAPGQAPLEPAQVDPGKNTLPGPLKYTGSLDSYPHFEVTPSIGREFAKDLQLTDLLRAENSDELIRDLAVLSEYRYVYMGKKVRWVEEGRRGGAAAVMAGGCGRVRSRTRRGGRGRGRMRQAGATGRRSFFLMYDGAHREGPAMAQGEGRHATSMQAPDPAQRAHRAHPNTSARLTSSLSSRRLLFPRSRVLPGRHDGPRGASRPSDRASGTEWHGHVRIFILTRAV
jgi:hypothetical protein